MRADETLNDAFHFGVAEFGLGLPLKLRFWHFHTDDSGEPLADVLPSQGHFGVLEEPAIFGVAVKGSRERALEAALMEAAVRCADVIRVREDIFGVGGIELQRNLHRYTLAQSLNINRLRVQHLLILVMIAHKGGNAALILERLWLIRRAIAARSSPFVVEADADTFIQKGEFSEPVAEHLV